MKHNVETTTETRKATLDYIARAIAAMTDDEVLRFIELCAEHGYDLPTPKKQIERD